LQSLCGPEITFALIGTISIWTFILSLSATMRRTGNLYFPKWQLSFLLTSASHRKIPSRSLVEIL